MENTYFETQYYGLNGTVKKNSDTMITQHQGIGVGAKLKSLSVGTSTVPAYVADAFDIDWRGYKIGNIDIAVAGDIISYIENLSSVTTNLGEQVFDVSEAPLVLSYFSLDKDGNFTYEVKEINSAYYHYDITTTTTDINNQVITIPADDSETGKLSYTASGLEYDEKGHLTANKNSSTTFKHDISGVIAGYYNTKEDLTTLTYGSYFTLAYFNVNRQGHIDYASNKEVKSYFVSGDGSATKQPPHIIKTLTSSEYESITTKDPNTIYFII